jgi:hypothetical protein
MQSELPADTMIGMPEAWPEWNVGAMDSALNLIQDYRNIVPLLRRHIDELRDHQAVTWAMQKAEEGHVPVAMHVIRNLLKVQAGPVPSVVQVEYAFRVALLTLVRTIQDITVLKRSLGHVVHDDVYTWIRDKVGGWLGAVPRRTVPNLKAVAQQIRQEPWASVLSDKLQTAPYWVESVRQSWTSLVGGGHIEYDTPALVSINAWNRSPFDHVRRDRQEVAHKILKVCDGMEWGAFLKLDVEDLIGKDAVGGIVVGSPAPSETKGQ